jgi:integrase
MPIETITKAGRKRFRWTFNRIIEGQRIRQTKVLPAGISTAEADSLARAWEAEIYAVATGQRKEVVTIGDCVKWHVADKCTEWKDATARIGILEKWAPEYSDQNAAELHDWSKSLVGYMRANRDRQGNPKRPLTDGTIRNVLAYLRAAIKYAFKVGKISEDQTARIAMPAVSNERHHYPDRREMLRIARKCRNRQVRAAIRIAFYSGMRKAEILRAKQTRKGFLLEDSKNGERRIIPVHPRIAVLARKIRFTIDEEKVSDQWDIARVLAGYPDTRFHDLRHGAASEMINSGVDLYTVGAVLGHMSPASTRRYSHLVTDRLAEAVAKIGKRNAK